MMNRVGWQLTLLVPMRGEAAEATELGKKQEGTFLCLGIWACSVARCEYTFHTLAEHRGGRRHSRQAACLVYQFGLTLGRPRWGLSSAMTTPIPLPPPFTCGVIPAATDLQGHP